MDKKGTHKEAPAEAREDDDDASTYRPSIAGLSDYLWNQALSADSVESRCILEMWREAVDAQKKATGEKDEAFCEAYYDAHLNEAWSALREGRAYRLNADGAICLIQQAAADRRALRAQPQAREEAQPVLTVWYGDMPESNGRSNWTASLHRKGGSIHGDGFCFARSEYPDRVRYEADRMRWIIGELAEKPDILSYDADAHSGYVAPTPPAPEAEKMRSVLADLVSWFTKPVQGERGLVWVIPAGQQGADDAVAAAIAGLQQEGVK